MNCRPGDWSTAAVFFGCALCGAAQADSAHHTLWQIQGKHNAVYLLGSIHVLRDSDYPLPDALLDAYAKSRSILMEINLDEMESAAVQQEMLGAATLPEGKTLTDMLGNARYAKAQQLAREVGVNLQLFDQFAPWFAAESVSQLQLMQLGFAPTAGVEMYFLQRAHTDGKSVGGLESAHDQISLFESMPAEKQAQYLLSSLEEAKSLPAQVESMVGAWRRGETSWFTDQMQHEFGQDQQLYRSLLSDRNRKWTPKIEALLDQNQNYLVIVGAGHLVGHDSVIELLKADGITAVQH